MTLPLIVNFKELKSTQKYLLENEQLRQQNYFCITTNNQTSGIGSQERSWATQKNQDIALSMVYQYSSHYLHKQAALLALPLLVSNIVHQFLSPLAGLKLTMKWPNDILHNHKKLAGILCSHLPKEKTIIIGIGINLNSTNHPYPQTTSTSLFLETKKSNPQTLKFKIEDVSQDLILSLYNKLNSAQTFDQDELQYYIKHSYSIGQNYNKDGVKGIVTGFTKLGEILVTNEGINYTISSAF